MDPITGLVATQAIQGVKAAAEGIAEAATSQTGGEFESLMRGLLPESSGNKVDEEALFSALLEERIRALKGEEAGNRFHELLEEKKSGLARSDGYVPVEQAANDALGALVGEEMITAEEADSIRSQAFRAAQLDDNHEALYDGRGSENDPTVAVANMESALLSARAIIEKLDSGEMETENVGEEATGTLEGSGETTEGGETTLVSGEGGASSGNTSDGEGGFLFKPEGEHSKSIVILLPPDLADDVSGLILKDENGDEVERGVSSGFANGGREHFRFTKSGAEYPQNLTVEVTLTNGEVINYEIPDPSQRYD